MAVRCEGKSHLGDAQDLVEAGGAQSGGGRPPVERGDHIAFGGMHTARPVQ